MDLHSETHQVGALPRSGATLVAFANYISVSLRTIIPSLRTIIPVVREVQTFLDFRRRRLIELSGSDRASDDRMGDINESEVPITSMHAQPRERLFHVE